MSNFTSPARTPDGLDEWQARKRSPQQNRPRPLTSARVERTPDGGINVHGDNGTSRILWPDNVDTPLSRAARAILNSVSDAPVEDVTDAPPPDPDAIPGGSLVTVTIGRNVNDGRGNVAPMHGRAWDEFVNNTVAVMSVAVGLAQIFGPFHGAGEWNGVTEDSVTFTFLLGPNTRASVKNINAVLSTLARDYGQDAIAWSYGPAFLARS